MPTRDQLDAAVAAGVIGRAKADRLADFLARPAQPEDAESIRFIRGFHDIFLAIGVVLLLVGASYTTALFWRHGAFGVAALLSLALAFYFTRRRRLRLPSIALSLSFGLSAGYLAEIFLPGALARRLPIAEPEHS